MLLSRRYWCFGAWQRKGAKMVPTTLHPEECSRRLLDVLVKLDSCPSGLYFNKCRWTFFSLSLGVIDCLELGTVAGKFECVGPLRALSQIATVLWVSRWKPCWFPKLDYLGTHLSVSGLKSWLHCFVCFFFKLSIYYVPGTNCFICFLFYVLCVCAFVCDKKHITTQQ